MKFTFIPILSLLFTISAFSQDFTVLTEATSIKSFPFSDHIIGTLSKGYSQELYARFKFWGKGESGWVNLDYTNYSQPTLKTGEINLKIFKVLNGVEAETDNGTLYLPANSIVIVAKEEGNYVVGVYKGNAVKCKKEDGTLESLRFEIEVSTEPLVLQNGENYETVRIPSSTPFLITLSGTVLYKGQFWKIKPIKKETSVDKNLILTSLNRLIGIYNSAKLSSPIADRLGYYVKTLSLKDNDLRLVKTPSGVGIVINLKHQFFTSSDVPITGRKTRLILKKSNYDFWKKVATACFNSGIDKFVEINILRYNPHIKDFECEGFVAASYNLYKEGKYDSYSDFLKYSDSDLSDDLWFFSDEFYERIDNGN